MGKIKHAKNTGLSRAEKSGIHSPPPWHWGYSFLPLLPFAYDSDAKYTICGNYDPEKINCPLCFPKSYTVNKERGGTPLSLSDMNTWGYASSFSSFLHLIGYKPTFSQTISDYIGGYPKGVVLYDFSEVADNGTTEDVVLRSVISLQDNNTKNFVYDADTNPSPYEIGSADENGIVWWAYDSDDSKYSLMAPDTGRRDLLMEISDITSDVDGSISWVSSLDGWYLIEVSASKGYVLAEDDVSEVLTSHWESYDSVEEALSDVRESEKVNAVFYYGYSDSEFSWLGHVGRDYEPFRIFSSKMHPFSSVIVPTNKGVLHQIKTYIGNEENPLHIKVYVLGILHSPNK